MSDLLNTLNAPAAPEKSWAQEVADAGAAEPAQSVSEPTPAPPVAETAPETAVEAPKPAETAQEEQDRRVPLKALQEERQKRSELERKLAMLEAKVQELPQFQPKQEPEIPEPDPETDPIGALKRMTERQREFMQQEAQRQHETRLNQIAYQSAQQFQAQAPDYHDAYKYAINSRAMELVALGVPRDYPGTQEQYIAERIRGEEISLIDTAVRNGKNPAQAIYEFAKARGFSVPAPAPVASAPAPVAVAPAPVAQAPNPALQQAKAAVAASASAGGAPASKGELTATDITNLKGSDFDAAWNKLFGGNKSSIFRE